MLPDWIILVLQTYGLAGVVMAALAWDNLQQRKNATLINNARLSERDILIKALESNTTAIRENAKVTEQRNVVTEALADALTKQAGVFDIFIQKNEFHQTTTRDTLQSQAKVIEALSESNRVNTGILKDIRDHNERNERKEQ